MFGLFFAGETSQVATAIVLTTTTGAVATGLVINDTVVVVTEASGEGDDSGNGRGDDK